MKLYQLYDSIHTLTQTNHQFPTHFFAQSSADSTYDVATEPPTLPMSHRSFPQSNTVRQIVTSAGAWLKVPNTNVVLSIPESAIAKAHKQNMFLSLLLPDYDAALKAAVPTVCTPIAPIVHCGPADVALNKPAVIRLPHCAELLDRWRVSLYYSSAHIQEPEPKWRKIVTLGEETLNTPAYVQMDEGFACIMTDFLGRFALIGESLTASAGVAAAKRLRLIMCGPAPAGHTAHHHHGGSAAHPHHHQQQQHHHQHHHHQHAPTLTECSIRVYVVEDLPAVRNACAQLEWRIGGMELAPSVQPLIFHDSGQDLCVTLACSGAGGWRIKAGAETQTIPFAHVWNGGGQMLHCAFALERGNADGTVAASIADGSNVGSLKLEVAARQRGNPDVVTATHVAPYLLPGEGVAFGALSAIDEYGTGAGNAGTSSSSSSAGSVRSVTISMTGGRQGKTATVTAHCKDPTMGGGGLTTPSSLAGGISAAATEVAFKLTRQAKRELCACLDPPTQRGNDWRMLAQRLHVDRYIAYFATKSSPTEHILDLWECRCREPNALADLSQQLDGMGRMDAVAILAKSMGGPAWV